MVHSDPPSSARPLPRAGAPDGSFRPEGPPEGPPEGKPGRDAGRDPVAEAGSELIGGPRGRHAGVGVGWWTPLRVVALTSIGMFALGMVQKLPCWTTGWFHGPATQYTRACYSDIPHLYRARGFADGLIPYLDRIPEELGAGMEFLEYPVLTGAFMEVAAWLTPGGTQSHRPEQYYWSVNAGMLMICAVVIALCVSRIHPRRPLDGLMVALSPALALTATINWDLLAGALLLIGLLLWSRSRPFAAGLLIGLATAAKLYPVLVLGPLLLLCLRAGRLRPLIVTCGGTVISWTLVNLPVMLVAREGWATFYTFSRERSVDFGSLWLLMVQRTDLSLGTERVNLLATAATLAGWVVLAVVTFVAPRRPRLPQLVFLAVAIFILFNKVYSPQYVLWLIPLAVLARPRWRDLLVWQAAEVLYFLAIWMYLAQTTGEPGLPRGGYHLAIALHLAATAWLCLVVLRDILRPARDPVRADGSDDPAGGILNGAADRFALRPHIPALPPEHRGAVVPGGGGDLPAVPAGIVFHVKHDVGKAEHPRSEGVEPLGGTSRETGPPEGNPT
ncbi:DUF2029 domain-containing protein [Streptomyces sp. IF17]|nr:DUF2029 domain-containing protein [Streptomyces alkaliphilus]